MNIQPDATIAVRPPDTQPYTPVEVESDYLELRSDQIITSIDESSLGIINEQLEQHGIRFQIKDNRAIMQVVDSTDKVIREIPNTHIQEVIAKLKEAIQTGKNLGLLIDEFV